MLFILLGLTLEVGEKTREYFKSRGFEVVQKYHYKLPSSRVRTQHGKRNYVSKEEVLSCDFTYEVNGILTGFNMSQITDAARGQKDCLLCLSPDTVNFVRYIKASFDECSTTVYVYIDPASLESITKGIEAPREGEIDDRLNTGKRLREFFDTDRNVFDQIALYSGEDSVFNYDSLFRQFDIMIEDAKKRQKRFTDRNYVELPYTGPLKYIFVSYAHADIQRVLPILVALQRAGYRVWYDKGIFGGADWSRFITDEIKNCTDFVLFSSENATKSTEIKIEINAARRYGKKPITVRFDNAAFEEHIEVYLTTFQNLVYNDTDFDEYLQKALSPETKD